MPCDYSKYPANWHEFSKAIRFERAQGRCECRGECGRSHGGRCLARNYEEELGSRVVLTVAHLNQDGGPCKCEPKCALPEHVLAMCNACHLRLDHPRHIRHARENRRRGKAHRELFDVER